MKIEEAKLTLEGELYRIYSVQKSIRWIFENHIMGLLENGDLANNILSGEVHLAVLKLNEMQLYAEAVRNLMNGLQEEIDALQISL